MNLCLDIGNTRTKAALFAGREMIWNRVMQSEKELLRSAEESNVDQIGITTVKGAKEIPPDLLNRNVQIIDHSVRLPIQLRYQTPETLGADRICAAVGGALAFPNSNVLTIDIGTCIKYEAINEQGVHLGGNIAPGMQMRFHALNQQTAALPLIQPQTRSNDLGLTTEQAIRNGVQLGILCELEAMISRMNALLPNLKIVLTGGDSHHFENDLKTPIFAHPLLVLEGLNEILLFNHQN